MARDKFHAQARKALEADGWTITHDPFRMEFEGDEYEADLGAEKLIAAERGPDKIVVEVKSFLGASVVYQFHDALGKYMNYQIGLKITANEHRELFIALPKQAYGRLRDSPLLMASVAAYRVNFMVFDSINCTIVSWIKS